MPRSDSTFYSYGLLENDLFAEIRCETYGEDFGQFSWITGDELRGFIAKLSLTANGHALDFACGSGGPALFIAKTVDCTVIVTGTLSREEIIARSSSMGQFLFTPAGVHEKRIQNAGFVDLQVEDVTGTIATTSKRWHDAREKRRRQLLQIEKSSEFETLQRMLAAAHTLASERRLSRFAYLARKRRTG